MLTDDAATLLARGNFDVRDGRTILAGAWAPGIGI